MSIIKKIFSAGDLVKDSAQAVISGVDKSIYTNEEKADKFNELLKLYEPFKLAQRYLAVLISAVYLGVHLMIFALWVVDIFFIDGSHLESIQKIATWNNDALFYPFLTINAFYFSGGVINSAAARFAKKINN